MNTIKIDGTSYEKSARFGNMKLRTIHRNKRMYDRKKSKRQPHEE